jgi:Holliday junction resolvase RusA-like endonuclease
METVIIIPGKPAPWAVYTRQGPPSVTFQRMKAWQSSIQAHARHAWGNKEPLTGPVVMDIEFWLEYPQSAPQRHEAAIERWIEKHKAMKPDRDNLQKACSDALQGIVYFNDSQVWNGQTTKNFATTLVPHTRITINPTGGG